MTEVKVSFMLLLLSLSNWTLVIHSSDPVRAQLKNSLFYQYLTTWRLPPAPLIRHSRRSAIYKLLRMNESMNEW